MNQAGTTTSDDPVAAWYVPNKQYTTTSSRSIFNDILYAYYITSRLRSQVLKGLRYEVNLCERLLHHRFTVSSKGPIIVVVEYSTPVATCI